MKAATGFSNLLAAASRGWQQRSGDDLVLSLAMPVNGVDPLHQLPLLAADAPFRFLWDGAPGLCLAAA
ncbi:MAG TPA: isochorismate synthase, partial [Prochlorococcaceae cyanobacterium Fu_MAG_50]|nr:isochorismate synthase [Prochlorococcaceae cyanobacterium Fu_MAG_50]